MKLFQKAFNFAQTLFVKIGEVLSPIFLTGGLRIQSQPCISVLYCSSLYHSSAKCFKPLTIRGRNGNFVSNNDVYIEQIIAIKTGLVISLSCLRRSFTAVSLMSTAYMKRPSFVFVFAGTPCAQPVGQHHLPSLSCPKSLTMHA